MSQTFGAQQGREKLVIFVNNPLGFSRWASLTLLFLPQHLRPQHESQGNSAMNRCKLWYFSAAKELALHRGISPDKYQQAATLISHINVPGVPVHRARGHILQQGLEADCNRAGGHINCQFLKKTAVLGTPDTVSFPGFTVLFWLLSTFETIRDGDGTHHLLGDFVTTAC